MTGLKEDFLTVFVKTNRELHEPSIDESVNKNNRIVRKIRITITLLSLLCSH